jgi:hypothetical protein
MRDAHRPLKIPNCNAVDGQPRLEEECKKKNKKLYDIKPIKRTRQATSPFALRCSIGGVKEHTNSDVTPHKPCKKSSTSMEKSVGTSNGTGKNKMD